MMFLPIVERELRVRARQAITHRFRLGSAITATLLVVFMLFMATASGAAQSMGQPAFHTLSWLAFVYCLFEGVRTTADAISEEKRHGTLGLLFLTDLKGYDVVLGKLFASSLNSFFALLAILPPLALPILLGGVTGGEFGRLALMLVTTLIFSLCTGMLVSVFSYLETRALGLTLGLLLIITLLPLLLLNLRPCPFSWLVSVSPGAGFNFLFDAEYRTQPDIYLQSLWLINLLSLLELGAASFLLPRLWQERAVRPESNWIERIGVRLLPQRVTKRKPRNRERWLLNFNPVLWLASVQQRSVHLLWALVGTMALAGLLSWMVLMANRSPSSTLAGSIVSTLLLIGGLIHLVIAFSLITQACHFFPEARESGAMELLLCTPLPVGQIVEGHRLALKRLYGPPVVTLVAVEFLIALGIVLLSKNVDASEAVFIMGTLAVALPVQLLDLYTAGEYGLWMGLKCRKATQAVTRTTLYVILLPGLAIFCCWPVFSAVKDLILLNVARDQLRRRFRALITEPLAEKSVSSETKPFNFGAPRKNRLPPVMPR